MMTRKEMMDNVVKTLGFENEYTVWFFKLAEDPTFTDSMLFNAMIAVTTMPLDEDED